MLQLFTLLLYYNSISLLEQTILGLRVWTIAYMCPFGTETLNAVKAFVFIATSIIQYKKIY